MASNEEAGKKFLKSLKSEERSILAIMLRQRLDNSIWIASNYDDLKKKFPDRFVAVRNREVIEDSPSEERLLTSLRTRYTDIRDIVISFIGSRETKLIL